MRKKPKKILKNFKKIWRKVADGPSKITFFERFCRFWLFSKKNIISKAKCPSVLGFIETFKKQFHMHYSAWLKLNYKSSHLAITIIESFSWIWFFIELFFLELSILNSHLTMPNKKRTRSSCIKRLTLFGLLEFLPLSIITVKILHARLNFLRFTKKFTQKDALKVLQDEIAEHYRTVFCIEPCSTYR